MKDFGPFDAYADALKAACPLILSKPNATVGYLQDLNPELAQRVATEYCAWLYYTPEHKYEMSMLANLSRPDDSVTHKKSCILPTFVSDPRYERGELKHIFALHNHPFGSDLSPLDLHFIEEQASGVLKIITEPWDMPGTFVLEPLDSTPVREGDGVVLGMSFVPYDAGVPPDAGLDGGTPEGGTPGDAGAAIP